MTATVYLREPTPTGGELECEDVRVLGNVVWATPTDEDREYVLPLDNILAIEGEQVHQRIDELPSPGGQWTELVTDIS